MLTDIRHTPLATEIVRLSTLLEVRWHGSASHQCAGDRKRVNSVHLRPPPVLLCRVLCADMTK